MHMARTANQNVLNDDRISRLLFKLTLPTFFGMFVQTLYNIVDTIFIGRYVGVLGIAGLSVVFPIQMIAMGIGQMMGMGGSSLISRMIGADKIRRAEHALGNAITGSVILSVVIMILGLFQLDFWLGLMGASETILPYAREYAVIILFGMLFHPIAMSLNSLIRAEGNTRVPMIGMMIGAVANIVLDALFIIYFKMGISGAALATVISQILTTLYFIRYLLGRKSFLQFHFKNLIIDWGIQKDIMSIGISGLFMTIAGSTSAILLNRALISYGSDLHLSAFGIIHRIFMFALMPGMVLGQGVQPILGFNYGAKRYDRALRSVGLALFYATAWSTLAFFALFFFPETFIRIFSSDPDLVALSAYAAKIIFCVMPLIGIMMVGNTIFQAIGKVIPSIITSLARSAIFLIPSVFILPRFFQADGVWMAFPVTDVLTSMLILSLLIPQLLKFRKMKNEPQAEDRYKLAESVV